MDLIATLRSFLRVAETGSFSAVAAERGMTQPAISRQVTALEERLGTRLVHRTTQSVTLTEEGRQLLEQARELVDEADTLLTWAAQARGRPVGQVRVAVSVPLGIFLGANINRLLDVHPDLSIDLVLRDHYGNLVEDGLDLEVRVGDTADSSLISRRIGSTRTRLVASPGYLAAHGTPMHPSELAGHDCIVHQREGNDDVWWFQDADPAAEEEVSVAVRGRFSSNNAAAVHRAALAGHGIACISVLLASEDIAAGRLVELLPDYPCRRYPIYIDYPSRRHLPLRVRVVIDFIALLSKEMRFAENDVAENRKVTR
jgi:DNA-binding transcriptional LysR family regulator